MAGKSMAVGGGGRFAALKAKLSGRKGVTNPGAVAASVGRKKYGSDRFESMARAGQRKATRVSRRGGR